MNTVNTYEPNEWNTGDVITAEKLNNIEYGMTDMHEFIWQLQGMKIEQISPIVPGVTLDFVTVNLEEAAIVVIFSSDTNSCAYGLWFHENGTGRYVPILATGSNLTITVNNGEYAGLTIKNKSTATAPAYANMIVLNEFNASEVVPVQPMPLPNPIADDNGGHVME